MGVPIEYLIFKISILRRSFFIILFILAVSLLLKQSQFAIGSIVGGLISVSIFLLLYKYVLALRGISASRRKSFIIRRALLIYIIMGITLFIAVKKGLPVFLGTAAGLICLKIAIFTEVFSRKKQC